MLYNYTPDHDSGNKHNFAVNAIYEISIFIKLYNLGFIE